jgi:arylsulfatase A-like enzyme
MKLLCVLALCTPSLLPAYAAEKPNILFLLSDDHSYPFVGAYGDTNVKTPALDQLAAEGMKFHRFFTGAPQCVPSRGGLMTGKFQGRFDLDYHVDFAANPQDPRCLPQEPPYPR